MHDGDLIDELPTLVSARAPLVAKLANPRFVPSFVATFFCACTISSAAASCLA
jgi:hypothetical protein